MSAIVRQCGRVRASLCICMFVCVTVNVCASVFVREPVLLCVLSCAPKCVYTIL